MSVKSMILAKLARALAPNPAQAVDLLREAIELVCASDLPSDAERGLVAVLYERGRQITEEGFLPDDDCRLPDGQLRLAAARYLVRGLDGQLDAQLGELWPWSPGAWKPRGLRRDLIRGAALAVAAVNRHLNLLLASGSDPGGHALDLAEQSELRGVDVLASWEVGGHLDLMVIRQEARFIALLDIVVEMHGDPETASFQQVGLPHRVDMPSWHSLTLAGQTPSGFHHRLHLSGDLAHQVQRALISRPSPDA